MGKLEEKLALVTGGNSGIGLATAKEFVREAEIRLARSEAIPNLLAFARYSFASTRFDQLGLNASGQTVPLVNRGSVLTGGVSIDLKTRNEEKSRSAARPET